MDGIFLTLTYENLPLLSSLNPQHPQKFLKRLRKRLNGTTKIWLDELCTVPNPLYIHTKYFLVGEYGSKTARPHYHLILWMPRPSDELVYSTSGEYPLYFSELLRRDWGLGTAYYGEVTAASAQYVAGYTLKKLFTQDAYPNVIPPFLRASQNLGLNGLTQEEIDNDQVTISPGYRLPLPRYVVERLPEFRISALKDARFAKSVEASSRPQPTNESRAIVTRARINLSKGNL